MTTPDRSKPIQPDQLAIPPEEIVCVVLALRPQDSLEFWEWVMQAQYDIEQHLQLNADWEDETSEERETIIQFLENLVLCNQACTSAATAAYIYKPLDGDEYHFITVEPSTALTIIHLMAQSQSQPDIERMYTVISNQVDRVFLERNEFANVTDE